MKKVIALVLILIMSVCVAEPIDFSAMEYGDLVSMYQQILEELHNRNVQPPYALPKGEYVVGEDIKPGKYIISGGGDDTVTILYDSKGGKMLNNNYFRSNPEWYVDLKEGNVLELQRGYIFVRKFEPIMF